MGFRCFNTVGVKPYSIFFVKNNRPHPHLHRSVTLTDKYPLIIVTLRDYICIFTLYIPISTAKSKAQSKAESKPTASYHQITKLSSASYIHVYSNSNTIHHEQKFTNTTNGSTAAAFIFQTR